MSQQCFYCSDEVEEKKMHHVSFLSSTEEREEKLCPECYQEWLHGMKG